MFDFDSDGMLSQAEIFNLVDISVRMQYQYSHFSANIAHQQYSTRIPSTSSSVRSPIPKDMMVGYSGSSPSFVDSPSVMEEIMNNYDPDKVWNLCSCLSWCVHFLWHRSDHNINFVNSRPHLLSRLLLRSYFFTIQRI